jgi:hypothetical protein
MANGPFASPIRHSPFATHQSPLASMGNLSEREKATWHTLVLSKTKIIRFSNFDSIADRRWPRRIRELHGSGNG